MRKVGSLVVIYIRLNTCTTSQLHCIHRVSVRSTWSYADLGSKKGRFALFEPNHNHLEYDCEEPGMKMGKVRKYCCDLHLLDPLFNITAPLHTPCASTYHAVLVRFGVRMDDLCKITNI